MGGPKKVNGRNLKDITNKLEARPVIAKTSRPTSSSSGTHLAGGYRVLKRPGEVWRSEELTGPPPKSLCGDESCLKKLQADGSGLIRHQDPPDMTLSSQGDPSPKVPNQ